MNATKIFAVAALATLSAVGAYAGEADYALQNQQQFNSVRTRAEVQAEAAQVAKNFNFEPAGSRVAALANSGVERAAVRNEAAVALRQGLISEGEV